MGYFSSFVFMKNLFLSTILFSFSTLIFSQEGGNDEKWKLFPSKKKYTADSVVAVPAIQLDSMAIDEVAEQDSVATSDSSATKVLSDGIVEIIQDFRIKNLLEKDAYLNEQHPKLDGYRVQIYFGSGSNSQKEANRVKSEFLNLYQDTHAQVDWIQPYFKTRVGNYRTRLEAEKFLNTISGNFPESFIVPTQIELPKLDASPTN